jgi:hypothetical protein
VSDALAGLLGKLFSFASSKPASEIVTALAGLNARQRAALDTLIDFLDRSIEECAAFAHYVVSLEDHQRRTTILGF